MLPRISSRVGLIIATMGLHIAAAQPVDQRASELPVVRCDPRANSCSPAPASPTLPEAFTAPGERAVVLGPETQVAPVQLDTNAYRMLIPGCTPAEPGVFHCQSRPEFQHCRTLMYSSMVHSCRVTAVFDGIDVEPILAEPADYELSVDSNARVRVTNGNRGFGEARGDADVELKLDPLSYVEGGWCLRQYRFLYRQTGKEGGVAAVDDPIECDEPLSFSFEPHEDDVLRAFDLCQSFAAWGEELTDSIDIVAAALFEVGSSRPEFRARYDGDTAVLAPYLEIEAPLTIDCRN